MTSGAPADLLKRLEELAQWLDAGAGVVLGLDFAGTLSPVVEEPTDASLSPSTRMVLAELADAPTVAPVVVGSRNGSDLADRVDIDGVVYAGNQGLELVYDDRTVIHPKAETHRPTIRRLCTEIDARLHDEAVSGYAVEDNGFTATVHFERASASDVSAITSTVEQVVSVAEDVRVVEGHRRREIRPAIDWDKGRAMRLLTDALPEGWRAMYVGDDGSDEDAYRAIQPEGIGIRVVSDTEDARTETSATYRLDGQDAVPRLLAWFGISLDSRVFLDEPADPWEVFLRTEHLSGDDSTSSGPVFSSLG